MAFPFLKDLSLLLSSYMQIAKKLTSSLSFQLNMPADSLKHKTTDTKEFSPKKLSRMKKFYEEYKDLSNLPTAAADLHWSFNHFPPDKKI